LEDRLELAIQYEGQEYQLDVDTLLVSLLHFSEMLRIAARRAGCPEGLRLTIEAPRRGSFKILLAVTVATGLWQYFLSSPQAFLTTVSDAVNIVLGAMQLKKLLKGQRPDKVETREGSVVVVKDGAQIVVAENVFQIYSKDSALNTNLEKMYEKLVDDPQVERLSIDVVGGVSFQVDSSDFPGMAQQNELVKEHEVKEIESDVRLFILKVVFQRHRKWEFVVNGNRISALIEDENFWRQVDAGRRFAKGDVLVADLEITKAFDSEVNCYVNKSYRIVRVTDYQPGPRQMALPF
jgi:hypothetical protein